MTESSYTDSEVENDHESSSESSYNSSSSISTALLKPTLVVMTLPAQALESLRICMNQMQKTILIPVMVILLQVVTGFLLRIGEWKAFVTYKITLISAAICVHSCECGDSVIMPTERQCVCCKEVDPTANKIQDNKSCITQHGGFEPICLNRWVMQVGYITYREMDSVGDIRADPVHE